MKKILLCAAMLCLGTITFAKPVDEGTANTTGLNFLLNNTINAFQTSNTLHLVYKATSNTNGSGTVYYYVFNADHGFVIVAGDDQAIPILGYSDEGTFNTNNMPVQVSEWLNGYITQMAYIVKNNIAATPEISTKWSVLINGSSEAAPQQAASGGTPLLATSWDQSPYYNDQCPYDNGVKRHTPTGCVATAMAQVMKFWNYPATGTGSHSYTDPSYGTQSAIFGATTYQWKSMPNTINSANAAIATLMYQCGVSVNMTYGPDESDAYVLSSQTSQQNCAEYALKAYFAYDKSLRGVLRSNYTDANWMSTIKAEIDSARPVIYTGTGSGGGHCFVCDGYRTSDNTLHFNWGWGGIFNGYFPINGLNPGTGGTGAGSGSYNSNEQAIIGIQPSKALLSYNIGLNGVLSLSSNSVLYPNTFTLYTNIVNVNNNSHNFGGDLCGEIFDSSNNIVDSFNIYTGITLNTGQNTGNMTVTIPGSPALLPGNYTVQVFYRPGGGNWTIVGNNGYNNSVKVKIYWSNTLELSAPIVVSPSVPQQGKPITVRLNAKNTGATQFNGNFYAYLYDLYGNPDFLIQKVSGSLNPDSSFSSGLTFTNSDDTIPPATYLLVIYYSPTAGQFDLMGSTLYQNPVKVTIAAPPLPPDQYEPDNTVDSAYNISPNFAMDSADVRTVGANINTGSDVDYYRIDIPAGYYYSFTGNLYDLRYPSSNQSYSLDGIFSFTEDSGKTWSDAFEHSFPGAANENGKSSAIFKVAPIFPGATGTYELEIKIKRTQGSGIEKTLINPDLLKVYPNPVLDFLNIDCSNLHQAIRQLTIIDMTGKQVFSINNPAASIMQLNVSNLSSGLYILKLGTDNGMINKQISIVR